MWLYAGIGDADLSLLRRARDAGGQPRLGGHAGARAAQGFGTGAATRKETLVELRRLAPYFEELDDKYATLADLWLKSAYWQQPSKVRWIIGGFLLALLLYLIVGIHLPAMAAWIFVALWGVISYFGYSRSAAHYASCLRQNERAIRDIENTIRRHYNEAKDCFLPLDYTAPSVLRELIAGLDSGMIASFEDYRINN